MKRKVTITIDESLYKGLHLEQKNVSGFINNLLTEQLMGSMKDKIIGKITDEIIRELEVNSNFIEQIADRAVQKARDQY